MNGHLGLADHIDVRLQDEQKQFRAVVFFSRVVELVLFLFYYFSSHIFVWNYLVVKMRFERPTFCIRHGTFCIQVSCSNNSTTSPTGNLSTSNFTTPKIDHNFLFVNSAIYHAVYVHSPRQSTDYWISRTPLNTQQKQKKRNM